jgi:hypothetical protein
MPCMPLHARLQCNSCHRTLATRAACKHPRCTCRHITCGAALLYDRPTDGTHTNMFAPGGLPNWVECAVPCALRPRPSPRPSPVPNPSPNLPTSPSPSPEPVVVVEAPVVNTPVAATSCDKAGLQALADGLKAQITNGMEPAKVALVFIAATECTVRGLRCCTAA